MSQTNPTKSPPKKSNSLLRILLVGSLALNLLVVGVVGGAVFKRDQWTPHRQYRPIDLGLGPIERALTHEQRRQIRSELRANEDLRIQPGEGKEQYFARLVRVIEAEPFERAEFEAALDEQKQRRARLIRAAHRAITQVVDDMTRAQKDALLETLRAELAVEIRRNEDAASRRPSPPPASD